VRALRLFLERYPEAARAGSKVRIVGNAVPGHDQVLHDAVAAAEMTPFVDVLGPLPRAQALDVISRSHLGLVLAQEQELQIPAKLYELVAMGIPTLVVAAPGSAAGLEGNFLGAEVRDSEDVEGIACVLEHLWRNDSQHRAPCPMPITYDVIAGQVDRVLRESLPSAHAWATVSA
jgi:hypothetical protein